MTAKQLDKQRIQQVVRELTFHPKNRVEVFIMLTPDEKVETFRWLSKAVRKDLVLHMPEQDLRSLIEAVDPDDATDMLRHLPAAKRDKVLGNLGEDLKDSLSKLLEFEPDTAAGLMTLDYIQVDVGDDILTVSKKFKLHESRTGRAPVIVALKDGKLAGFLPGHDLGFGRTNETVGKYVKRLPSISQNSSHNDVLAQFRSHPHSKVAVLNDQGNVIGIIYSDDVIDLLREQNSSSLYSFAGLSQEESVADPARRKIKSRYKWLIINLGTAFLAAFTVGLFEETISKYVLLAVYMPIVAGMGGNAATQTLAVMVRGIALKQISLGTALRTLKNELMTGFANGLINGLIVAAVVLTFNRDAKIALVLGVAMVANLLVAGFFGTLVPLIMAKLGKDPAASATIFITTATDVLGFLVFLGLGKAILG